MPAARGKKRGAIQLEIPTVPKKRGRVLACGQGDVGQLGLGGDVVETSRYIKFDKASTKVLQNFNRDTKTKPTLKKSTGKTKNAKTTKDIETTKNTRKKSKHIENTEKYTCNFCGEDYIEVNGQPLDDWIQCISCKQWSHEKCTAFEGTNRFTCDHCTDN
ncbi:hypothetical protein ACJJTC_015052 [Scirpophaga incertulas]